MLRKFIRKFKCRLQKHEFYITGYIYGRGLECIHCGESSTLR